ncbi:hypothetical protein DAPPUDRAFT_232382 [Daphnia pulex]|uniref:Focal AT domain-containing protein n=1 Tax=Daphnia pulex TaxID=6669 RepID=E9FQS9_DAPPU|nr:hypothetical protein DAPPUDRAFT_232382 [Daphnia pulex]|eukprot:EFX90320.1 hypothetical protein DAPPUDRAFT_232382 [Daphnia pulex]
MLPVPVPSLSEILMEERWERDETMSRENRRAAAISRSWTGSAGNGEDLPPPKHSRVPAAYFRQVRNFCILGSIAIWTNDVYLVAPNSEVLAQLMRDNETSADAGQPASAFNTFTVEFSHTISSNSNPASPQHKSKTMGSKNQPVYANIMMADATPPSAEIAAAAVETYPAPYKNEPNEPYREPHMEQERRMLEWKLRLCNGSRKRIFSLEFLIDDRSDSDSMDGANAYHKDRSTPLRGNQLDDRSVIVKKLEPTPTARLDRTHDKVYDATTSVVRAVLLLSQGVQLAKIENYVDLKVHSKDMAELVSALKLAEWYSNTTLDNEYRKSARIAGLVSLLAVLLRITLPIKLASQNVR